MMIKKPFKLSCALLLPFVLSACNSDVPNMAPASFAGDDMVVDEATVVTLHGAGADVDGQVSSYSWAQTKGTAVTLDNAGSATASFTAPTLTEAETLTFNLTVTDDAGASTTAALLVTVNPVNLAPVVDAGVDQMVDEFSLVTLTGSVSDSDGSITSYHWAQTSGPEVELSDADSLTATFTAPQVDADQTLTFKLTASDNENASTEAMVNVQIHYQVKIAALEFQDAVLAECVQGMAQSKEWRFVGEMNELTCMGFDIGQLDGVEQLTSLTTLSLPKIVIDTYDNWISDLSPLAGLSELTFLNLDENREIVDITPLSQLHKLQTVYLAYNLISDLSPLTDLNELETLILTGNRLLDIESLAGMTSLAELYVGANRISDLRPLGGLTELRKLGLENNIIADIGPLSGLSNLTYISLFGNEKISCIAIDALQVELPDADIWWPENCAGF